jgi:peptidoglycan hydrolase-like protein with peptidoglycan-binding domain
MSAAYKFLGQSDSTENDPALYEGDFGVAVVELQKLLNAKGANLFVDGFFGPATKIAVINFQQRHKFVPDGAIGSMVWRELRRTE